MTDVLHPPANKGAGVALVDGNAAVRHARQLMLRSEQYDVKSYATCAALLADPDSRNYACIILDVEMEGIDGLDLLTRMRASGWHGRAILLDGLAPESAVTREVLQNGDRIEERSIGDSSLLSAVAATFRDTTSNIAGNSTYI
jgi:FixJ family two-component response regulator